jgi:hypothetical protein
MACALLAPYGHASAEEAYSSEDHAFALCMATINTRMTELGATPERYQMVMRASCLDEQRTSEERFEKHLRSISDQGARPELVDQVTAETMREVRTANYNRKEKWIAIYTIMYEERASNALDKR